MTIQDHAIPTLEVELAKAKKMPEQQHLFDIKQTSANRPNTNLQSKNNGKGFQ